MPDSQRVINRRIGNYTVVARISAGGFGSVWKVKARDGSTLSAKIMNPELAASKEAIGGFKKEFALCSSFDHPGLLKYLDFGMFEDLPFMVMEYFESVTLKAACAADAPFPIRGEFLNIFTNIARTLDYIHEKGIIHRDIKPDNILVNSEGKTKLIDFSIALKGFSTWLPFMRRVEGTPSYMPPEQIMKKKVTAATDIYAFGATIYELLAGRPPFTGETQSDILSKQMNHPPTPIAKLNDHVSPGLDKLVMDMLAKDPADRPRDMSSFLRQLKRVGVYREV